MKYTSRKDKAAESLGIRGVTVWKPVDESWKLMNNSVIIFDDGRRETAEEYNSRIESLLDSAQHCLEEGCELSEWMGL